jgi:hypothetical protein
MKKNITILLIMAIAATGLFAGTSTQTLKVAASVGSVSSIRIVDKDSTSLVSTDTLDTFNAISALTNNFTTTITEAPITLAKLNFYSKQIAAFTTTLSAKSMAGLTTGNTSTISYTATVGTGTEAVSVVSSDTGSDLTITLKPITTGSSLAGSLPISVDANDDDWASAPVGSYVGELTFTFVTM